jgi:hypothetical protein
MPSDVFGIRISSHRGVGERFDQLDLMLNTIIKKGYEELVKNCGMGSV